MTARTHGEPQRREAAEPKRASGAEATLNFAAAGCLVAGMVGIIKAVEMQRATDGLLCVIGSLAACALVCFLYFRNDR
jgi:UDP-N-acetylmuramyl pentapeptide phosphotransferase/UDP-N-acetylglucosamine-1-phosphate transferase